MPRVRAGEVQLGWRAWGKGDVTLVFIHGNLACKEWIDLAAPLFPSDLRVIGIDCEAAARAIARVRSPTIPTIPCVSTHSTCSQRLMS